MDENILPARFRDHLLDQVEQSALSGAVAFPCLGAVVLEHQPPVGGDTTPLVEQSDGPVCIGVVGRLVDLTDVVGHELGDDGKAGSLLRSPADDFGQFVKIVLFDHALDADPRGCCMSPAQFVDGLERTLDGGDLAALAYAAKGLWRNGVERDADGAQTGLGQRSGAALIEQQAVRLEADRRFGCHAVSGSADEVLQLRVHERLADAVEDKGLQVVERRFEAREGVEAHVVVADDAVLGMLDTHRAGEVAMGRGFDEELGGVGQ